MGGEAAPSSGGVPEPVTLAAVDHDRMRLDGLRAWLPVAPDLRLVAAAASVEELLAGPGRAACVVLLDLQLRDGSAPARNVRRLVAAGLRVLLVGQPASREQLTAASQAGAAGFVSCDHDLASLARAVRAVAAGGIVFLAESPVPGQPRPRLSGQERVILAAYASGMTLRAAAGEAGVRTGTAKEYLDRIKEKYAAAGRTARTKFELAQRAREDGIMP